ncbi:hypothetical protein XENORESO_002528, partial [Xenotaenia resolanae]
VCLTYFNLCLSAEDSTHWEAPQESMVYLAATGVMYCSSSATPYRASPQMCPLPLFSSGP